MVDKFVAKLNDWKAKLISIGGRLTLIKALVDSIAWDRVISLLDAGGLGVGSLFAYSLALLYKWYWRFVKIRIRCWNALLVPIRLIGLLPRLFTLDPDPALVFAARNDRRKMVEAFVRESFMGVTAGQRISSVCCKLQDVSFSERVDYFGNI
ncbi:hypothetical protein LXL04_025462 [Taraxacum kok-saghyz]